MKANKVENLYTVLGNTVRGRAALSTSTDSDTVVTYATWPYERERFGGAS